MSNNISTYSPHNVSPNSVFSFQRISRTESITPDAVDLKDWILESELLSIGDQTITGKYRSISFSLSEKSASYFPLLRGIFASSRSSSFSLQTSNRWKSFILNFEVSQEAEAKAYLSRALHVIKGESRFKQVLRKIMVNQEKFEQEQKLLISELSQSGRI